MFCMSGDRVEPPSSMQFPLVYNSFSAKQKKKKMKDLKWLLHTHVGPEFQNWMLPFVSS